MVVAYRDDFCARLLLTDACPAARSEVAISRGAAQQLGVGIGDRVMLRKGPANPGGAYWSNRLFRTDEGLDPLFTPFATFTDLELGIRR